MAITDTELPPILLSPASELVYGTRNGSSGSNLIFARHGSDIVYGSLPRDIPQQSSNQGIDLFFGDLFDTSIPDLQWLFATFAGNPWTILNTGLQIGWADRFVLGDWRQSYYLNEGNSLDLLSTNVYGFNEFALIFDFNPQQDIIQLNGKPQDYSIVKISGLNSNDIPGVAQLGLANAVLSGAVIFSLKNGIPDLVTFVLQPPDVTLDLQASYFEYVGDTPSPKPTHPEIIQFGSYNLDVGYFTAIDPSGNIFVSGWTTGSLQGNNSGSVDAWVAKYDSSGNQLWRKQLGTPQEDNGWAITTDKLGNLYFVGATSGDLFSPKISNQSDAWVAKFDGDGNLLWSQNIGSNLTNGGDVSGFIHGASGVSVDDAGNVYATGLAVKPNTRQDIFGFPAQDDSWVVKFDSNGNRQWVTQFGGLYFDESYALTVDKNGNSYALGWTREIVEPTDPSRVFSKYDAMLIKIAPDGSINWIEQLASVDEGLEFGWGVVTDSKNNIYVSGWTSGTLAGNSNAGTGLYPDRGFNGSYDVWLAKYDSEQNLLWTQQFGTSGDDVKYIGQITVDLNDNIYLAGYTDGNLGGVNAGSYDAWVGSFDSNGNQRWLQQFGTAQADFAAGVSIDNSLGALYVTGYTEGSLGNINKGAQDVWLAKLDINSGQLAAFNPQSNTIAGTLNNDSLSGTSQNDQINGLFGNDTIAGLDGKDILDGDDGIDTVSYRSSSAQVKVNLDQETAYAAQGGTIYTSASSLLIPTALEPQFTLTAGKAEDGYGRTDTLKSFENIIGSAFNDILIGNKTDNLIEGLSQNDLIIGNAGNDTLDGGQGIDTVSYRRDLKSVNLTLDFLFSGVGFAQDGFGGNDTLRDVENLIGSNFNDQLIGDSKNNTFLAGSGKDTVSGGGGNDIILGEDGNDSLKGDDGDDYLVGGKGADTLDGGLFGTSILGFLGRDTASYFNANSGIRVDLATGKGSRGDAAGDVMIGIENVEGSEFQDRITGDTQSNQFWGLGGNDTVTGAEGDDTIFGGAGNDSLIGGDGNDYLLGGDGNDVLRGGNALGGDTLEGGEGNDQLYVDNLFGESILDGGKGRNALYGSNSLLSRDQFILTPGEKPNTIYNFQAQDLIGLRGLNFNQIKITQGKNSNLNNSFIRVPGQKNSDENDILGILIGVQANIIKESNFFTF